MNNYEQLHQRLIVLKESGHKEITVGVDFLLDVLNSRKAVTVNEIKEKVFSTSEQNTIEVDGGQFGSS